MNPLFHPGLPPLPFCLLSPAIGIRFRIWGRIRRTARTCIWWCFCWWWRGRWRCWGGGGGGRGFSWWIRRRKTGVWTFIKFENIPFRFFEVPFLLLSLSLRFLFRLFRVLLAFQYSRTLFLPLTDNFFMASLGHGNGNFFTYGLIKSLTL